MARQLLGDKKSSLILASGSVVSTGLTPASTVSFGMWLKLNQTISSFESFMTSVSGGNGISIARNADRNIYLELTNGGVLTYANWGAANYPSGWAHFAVTATTGSVKLYLNGTLITTQSRTVSTSGQQVRICQSVVRNTGVSEFVFDNGTIWTAEQVAALYTSGTVPSTAEQVLPLDEGAGTVAYDTSGNGNNGTITSGTWTRDTPTKTRKLVNNNLVYNGDFEIAPPTATNVATTTGGRYVDGTAGGSVPSARSVFGWMMWNYIGSYAAQFDYSVKRDGIASMKISTTATASTVGLRVSIHNDPSFKHNNIPVLPSTSYTASGWVKTSLISGSATTGARLRFVTSTGTGDVTTVDAVASIVTTTDWTQYSVTFTTAATARFITPVLQILGNDGAGTLIMDAWFADIQLYPTTPVTRNALTFARQPVDELVRNGDFEYAPAFTAATTAGSRWIDGTAGGGSSAVNIYGWYTSVSAGTFSAQFDTAEKYTGATSMKLTTSAGGWTEIWSSSTTPRRRLIPVLPSTSYTVSGWMKTELISGSSATGARFFVNTYSGAGTYIATPGLTTAVSTTTDWTYYTHTFTTPSDARFAMAIGSIRGNHGAATLAMTAYFDNISLKLTTPTGRSAV